MAFRDPTKNWRLRRESKALQKQHEVYDSRPHQKLGNQRHVCTVALTFYPSLHWHPGPPCTPVELISKLPGKRPKDFDIRSPSTISPSQVSTVRLQLANPTGYPEHPVIFLVPHFFFFSNIILKQFHTYREAERKVRMTPIYPVSIYVIVYFLSRLLYLLLHMPLTIPVFSPLSHSLSPLQFFSDSLMRVSCRCASKYFRAHILKTK